MIAATKGVQANDTALWEVMLLFRRFLHAQAHEELQGLARDLYGCLILNNEDAVWLILSASQGRLPGLAFFAEGKWDIGHSVDLILPHGQ